MNELSPMITRLRLPPFGKWAVILWESSFPSITIKIMQQPSILLSLIDLIYHSHKTFFKFHNLKWWMTQ
jgi:hypothetical protein